MLSIHGDFLEFSFRSTSKSREYNLSTAPTAVHFFIFETIRTNSNLKSRDCFWRLSVYFTYVLISNRFYNDVFFFFSTIFWYRKNAAIFKVFSKRPCASVEAFFVEIFTPKTEKYRELYGEIFEFFRFVMTVSVFRIGAYPIVT